MTEELPKEGDLQVWYIPQIPGEPFTRHITHREGWTEREESLALSLLLALTEFSAFEYENRVKPDYSDMGGISRFTDGEWDDLDEDELWDRVSVYDTDEKEV